MPRPLVQNLYDRIKDDGFTFLRQSDVDGECGEEHDWWAESLVVSVGHTYREIHYHHGCEQTPFLTRLEDLYRVIDTSLGASDVAWKLSANCFEPSAWRGRRIFEKGGCVVCHRFGEESIGSDLQGLFGRTVTLADGTTIVADRAYVEESILDPAAKLVKGYPPSMPAFRGKLRWRDVEDLLVFLEQQGMRTGGDSSSD